MYRCDRDWFGSAIIFITLIIVTTLLLATFVHLVNHDDSLPNLLTKKLNIIFPQK